MVKSEDPHHESRKQHPDGLDLPSHKRPGGQVASALTFGIPCFRFVVMASSNYNLTIFITRLRFHLTDTKSVFLEMVKGEDPQL
ncbi:hypothetical protein CEXT_663161 [Caerostris extrusa]|uniref:Uncharacterized protein n=1 Tax=Caerostris extrusa TaxID=172846 RepID=A0AAV4SKG7_CAEEX|nr:hypothetical protein CEXT_663161 [Caerostris extrusa]